MSPLLRRLFPLVGCVAVLRAQTLDLENFNNPGATGAALAGSTWANAVTRNADSITVGANARDDNGWGAAGLNLNANAQNFLTIFARRDAGNLAPSLVVQFEDPNLRTYTVSVSTSLFAVGTITAVQIPLVWPAAFDRAHLAGWTLGGGTVGNVAFRLTLDQLTLSTTSVLTAPAISTQPADRLAGVGAGVAFTVAATGAPALRYQWKRHGTALPGATTATLDLANLALADADTYQVDVTNDLGTTPSRVATLVVVDAQPTHALAAANASGFTPGSPVTITNTISYAGSLTNLGWQVLLPDGWSYAADGGAAAPQTKPALGATHLAEWSWTTVPPNPITFSYTLNVPPSATTAQSLTAQFVVTQAGLAGTLLAKPDPLVVPPAIVSHSADTNGDFKLSLLELTR
ncbi:MAG: hypothetical protein RLZZ15_1621, partial [Verrucomicrobiota bacterium]